MGRVPRRRSWSRGRRLSPRIELDAEDIQKDLDRRRPGQSKITSQRKETDRAEILSGVLQGRTLGTPIHIIVWNEDKRPKDYELMKKLYRPSHADYSYQAKYGIRNWMGGGRASNRETVGRVAGANQLSLPSLPTATRSYVRSRHSAGVTTAAELTNDMQSYSAEKV